MVLIIKDATLECVKYRKLHSRSFNILVPLAVAEAVKSAVAIDNLELNRPTTTLTLSRFDCNKIM